MSAIASLNARLCWYLQQHKADFQKTIDFYLSSHAEYGAAARKLLENPSEFGKAPKERRDTATQHVIFYIAYTSVRKVHRKINEPGFNKGFEGQEVKLLSYMLTSFDDKFGPKFSERAPWVDMVRAAINDTKPLTPTGKSAENLAGISKLLDETGDDDASTSTRSTESDGTGTRSASSTSVSSSDSENSRAPTHHAKSTPLSSLSPTLMPPPAPPSCTNSGSLRHRLKEFFPGQGMRRAKG